LLDLLIEYPLLLLFMVASFGYLLGTFQLKGNSLGVAAILFTGLAFGAIDERLAIPEIVFQLGLSIFLYSVGLNSGPAFFAAYRKNGLRDFAFIFAVLVITGGVASLLWSVFGFSAAQVAGVFTGTTTNTAALAGVINYMNNTGVDARLLKDIVGGFTYSYPMGVLGGMIAIVVMERLFKINYAKEAKSLKGEYPSEEKLQARTVEVTQQAICGMTIREIRKKHHWNINFGRVFQGGDLKLPNADTSFSKGDMVTLIGAEEDLEEAIAVFGRVADTSQDFNKNKYSSRRIFVSNPEIVGRSLASLEINERYSAVITRIRRGEVDMLADGATILELGDRVRFIASNKDLEALSEYFGDSYTASSKVNLFSFGLGIGLGLLLGSFEFNIGEDFRFKLGYAGGPLIMGLLFGALRRTGPIIWSLPFGANVTLQQIGLILLLSSIGVSSGHAFVESFSVQSLWIFGASVVLSLFTAFGIFLVGYRWLKMPFGILMGMVSNQPAILDFATNRAQNRLPVYGFAMIFPIALICKIIIAQLLFVWLN